MRQKLLLLLFSCLLGSSMYAQISVELGPDITICQGESVALSPVVNGGTSPYTYAWSDGSTLETNIVNPSFTATYSVTATDIVGQTATDEITVLVATTPAIDQVATTVTHATCEDQVDGTIDLVMIEPGPFFYEWSNSETTEDLNGLAGGDYTVTITNTDGCITVENFTVLDRPTINTQATTIFPADCQGSSTGGIILVVDDASSSSFSYIWSGPTTIGNTSVGTDLLAGTYFVIVTDANGCTDEATLVVPEPSELLIDEALTVVTDASCDVLSDGSVYPVVSGGTEPYTYEWSNGDTVAEQDSLSPGSHILTVTDTNGCTDEATFDIAAATAIEIIVESITPDDCEANGVGAIDISVSGGEAPYFYTWSDGQATQDISFLVPGVYEVWVTDVNGCFASSSFTVPGAFTYEVESNTVLDCGGQDNGLIAIVNAPEVVSYLWSNNETGPVINDIPAGNYCVTMTDGNGCQMIDCFFVTSPPPIVIQPVVTPAQCSGLDNGTATIQTLGGNPPFLYEWSHGPTTAVVTNLAAGEYVVTVTDATGCQETAVVTITTPSELSATITGIPEIPCPETDIILEVVPTGGTSPYSFLWVVEGIPVATEAVYDWPDEVLFSSSITAEVTDANGCEFIAFTSMNLTLPVAVDNSDNYISCISGTAMLNGTGSATGPNISYEWSGPDNFSSDQLITITTVPGTYTLVVTNNAQPDCSNSAEVIVTALDPDFNDGIDATLISCNEYQLSALIPNGYTDTLILEWTFPDGSNSDDLVINPNQTGVYTLTTMAPDAACEFYSTVYIDLEADDCATLSGRVHWDEDEDCNPNSADPGLAGWLVMASGNGFQYITFTDADGLYNLNVPVETEAVAVLPPSASWDMCEATVTLTTPLSPGEERITDFPAKRLVVCPELSIDLEAVLLRRCFPSTYWITVTNQGTETAEFPEVNLLLDPFLEYLDASLSPTIVDGQFLSWNIPSLPPGESHTFWINVFVSCEAELGQTHCSEASVTPDPLCTPGSGLWTGVNLELSGECVGNEVQFTVTNNSDIDLSEAVSFIVIEDVVAMMQPQQLSELLANETQTFTFPSDGSTYTFQIDQVLGHPFSQTLSLSIEGCGNNFTQGIVTQFSQTTATPGTVIDCEENVGSYDPNDKAANPVGYGPEHYIVPETEIDYRIRFQNTGTDTAFTVVIRDQISELLDLSSLRLGTSSHDYIAEVTAERALTFTFNNILLPDSTTNEPASNGFVNFKISPIADAPLEEVIENDAAIYFDFNEPIITNTVFHTLGRNFLEITRVFSLPELDITWDAYPNPVANQLWVQLNGEDVPRQAVLSLTNAQGQTLREQQFSGTRTEMNLPQLPAGIYQLQLRSTDGVLLGTASLVKR